MENLFFENYEIEVNRKKIKNVNLKVYPNCEIKVSIPEKMDIEYVQRMINSKAEWLKKQLQKYEEQKRIETREYVSGEDHYFNGKRYILKVHTETKNVACIKIERSNIMDMYVKENSSVNVKSRVLNNFYKEKLEKKIKKYLEKWEEIIGVKVNDFSIRKMKNRWGSCNVNKKTIIFNLELAKKSNDEIQFVVVHELVHLIERYHNDNFRSLMDKFYPKWKKYQNSINELL